MVNITVDGGQEKGCSCFHLMFSTFFNLMLLLSTAVTARFNVQFLLLTAKRKAVQEAWHLLLFKKICPGNVLKINKKQV